MMNLSRLAAIAVFVSSGTLHLVRPEIYESIMPPALPYPHELVIVSGVAEIAGAAGIALLPTRRPAAIGLIALLIAVFPANVYMAMAYARFAALAPAWVLFARLPLQAVMIAWVWSLRD